MKKRLSFFFIFFLSFCLANLPGSEINFGLISPTHVKITIEKQHPVVRPQSSSALAIQFDTEKDWHFYASQKTAPGSSNLKLKASSTKDFIKFSNPIYPPSEIFQDKYTSQKVDVFIGKFTVYLPFTVENVDLQSGQTIDAEIKVAIEGSMCSAETCILPKFEPLTAALKISADANMNNPLFTLPAPQKPMPKTSIGTVGTGILGSLAALLLAFLAGVTLNIMPCVLPVIPLKVLSIFEQAKQDKKRSMTMGLVFCIGILVFFAILAGINISLHLKGGFIQWGGQFQNPVNIIIMSMVLIALALFMFGVFTINVPSSIAAGAGAGPGLASSAAMGFFAAVLSTPCSFGILTASLLWAQTQNLFVGTIAIMVIGIGMAAPYMILTSMPALLKFIPRPGRWTEIFKQTAGFVLLVVALWLLTALPAERFVQVLYFGLILSFCLWMWGGWVTFTTPLIKKIIVRIIALLIVVPGGIWLLPAPAKSEIDWQKYDSVKIQEAVAKGRPVLIDFTADWCLNCKAVEKFVFSDTSVSRLIKQKAVFAVIGDVTQSTFPAAMDLINIYKEPAVPVTVFLLPAQEPVKLRGILIKGKLLEYLRQLPDAVHKSAEGGIKADQ